VGFCKKLPSGEAEKAGLRSDEDVVGLIEKMRSEEQAWCGTWLMQTFWFPPRCFQTAYRH